MEEYYDILKKSPLFSDINDTGIKHILNCLEARVVAYGKGELIYGVGDIINYAAIVLEGKVEIQNTDNEGNILNVQLIMPSDAFGTSYACLNGQNSIMNITAKKKTKIMQLKLTKLFRTEALGCKYASHMTVNLLKQTAAMNLAQNIHINIMSQKSIRGKILMYITTYGENETRVQSPMNRQELADYLGTERSALSRELSKMKKEGIIDYKKNELMIL